MTIFLISKSSMTSVLPLLLFRNEQHTKIQKKKTWGTTARLILTRIAQRIADRTGQHRGSVAAKSARWLLSRHQRRVADILLLAMPPDLTA